MHKKIANRNKLAEARSIERRGMAVAYRLKGLGYRQIAQAMRDSGKDFVPPKYDEAKAFRDVKQELDRAIKENAESSEALRLTELMRLDRLLMACERGIASGDAKTINTAIRIGESRRRLLGMDEPERQELEVKGGMTIVAPDQFETAEEWQKQSGR